MVDLEVLTEKTTSGVSVKEISKDLNLDYRKLLTFCQKKDVRNKIYPLFPKMEFNCKSCGTKSIKNISGKKIYCENCCKDAELRNTKKYKSSVKGINYHKEYALDKKYNLTVDQFNKMVDSQGNCCKICLSTFFISKLHIDHCHKTGKVRGLLCSKCNQGLGLFQDSLEILNNAMIYIMGSKYGFQESGN